MTRSSAAARQASMYQSRDLVDAAVVTANGEVPCRRCFTADAMPHGSECSWRDPGPGAGCLRSGRLDAVQRGGVARGELLPRLGGEVAEECLDVVAGGV